MAFEGQKQYNEQYIDEEIAKSKMRMSKLLNILINIRKVYNN